MYLWCFQNQPFLEKNIVVYFEEIEINTNSRTEIKKYIKNRCKITLIRLLKDLGYENEKISKDWNGKSRIESGRVNFSISYSQKKFVIAISKGNVGVDIENIRSINIQNLLLAFSDEENRIINVYQSFLSSKIERFFFFWTFKEAFGKFLGVGLNYDLNESHIYINEISLDKWIKLENLICSLYSTVIDNTIISLCSKDEKRIQIIKKVV